MPKKGPDKDKIKKIKQVLSKNPSGLWVREIARQTNLDKSTVSLYLSKYIESEIEEIFSVNNRWIKFVRLRK